MNLLEPSLRMQRAIAYDARPSKQFPVGGKWARYSAVPIANKDLTPFFAGVTEEMQQFYRRTVGLDGLYQQMVCNVLWEMLDNARVHGSDNPGAIIEVGLFLGKKGACYVVKDEGDYFKRAEIKAQYEHKRNIVEFDKVHPSNGFGVNKFIYPHADMIEVNTDIGALCCAQMLGRLKKPKR